jgi:hypothetical protein
VIGPCMCSAIGAVGVSIDGMFSLVRQQPGACA